MKPSLTTKALFSNFFVPTRTKCLQKCWPDQEENRCYFSARSEAADQERTIFQESSIRPHLFVAHKKNHWHTIGTLMLCSAPFLATTMSITWSLLLRIGSRTCGSHFLPESWFSGKWPWWKGNDFLETSNIRSIFH